MKNTLRLWADNKSFRIWVVLQSIHFAWAIVTSESRPVRIGDPLLWYLEQHSLMAANLGLVFIPQLKKWWKPVTKLPGRQVKRPIETENICPRINEMLEGTVILDSNIWMNPLLDKFFQKLQNTVRIDNRVLTLFGPQFDELCNIKDRLPYASKRGRLARLALSRIEAMQGTGCLRIDPFILQAHPKAYADPKILTLIQGLTSDSQRVYFVSDDRELRIRARQIADLCPSLLTVRTSKTLLNNL